MKRARQAEIMDIIQGTRVENQEQLLLALKQRGFTATQATISRDIKQLGLVKELSASGSYHYVPSGRRREEGSASRLRNIFKEGVVSVEAAQNIVVVKTMPGLASAACSALDSMDIPGMVGSLAGDDTGILIMRDSAGAEAFGEEIRRLLK